MSLKKLYTIRMLTQLDVAGRNGIRGTYYSPDSIRNDKIPHIDKSIKTEDLKPTDLGKMLQALGYLKVPVFVKPTAPSKDSAETDEVAIFLERLNEPETILLNGETESGISENKLAERDKELSEKEEELVQKSKVLSEKEEFLNERVKLLSAGEREFDERITILLQNEAFLKQKKIELDEQEKKLQQQSVSFDQKKTALDEHKKGLQQKATELNQRKQALDQQEKQFQQKTKSLNQKKQSLDDREKNVQQKTTALSKKEKKLQQKNTELNQRKQELDSRDSKLQQKAATLNRIASNDNSDSNEKDAPFLEAVDISQQVTGIELRQSESKRLLSDDPERSRLIQEAGKEICNKWLHVKQGLLKTEGGRQTEKLIYQFVQDFIKSNYPYFGKHVGELILYDLQKRREEMN